MRQTILVPRDEVDIVKEITSRGITEEVCELYGEEGVILENSYFFEDDIEARLRLVIAKDVPKSIPYTEVVLYKDDVELEYEMSTEGKYEGLWSVNYNGTLYELEVKAGMDKETWQQLFKEKYAAGEFNTDSDIEDFAEECGVGYGSVFHYLDVLTSIGTPCERCKHIGYRYSMFPCNCCSKNPEIKNRFEEE